MFDFVSSLASERPLLTFSLYIIACALAGVGIFSVLSLLRKKLENNRNLKRRVPNDKSC